MILRLSSSVPRAMLVVVAFSFALFLSYFSIRSARAVHSSGLQTRDGFEHATYLEPGNYLNWYKLGRYWQYNLDDPDAQRSIHAYLSALSLNPRSTKTWLDLATAYESENNFPAARDAFLHAKRVYPVSADVSWRYGNFLLRQGELEPAFLEIRRAVDVDPKRGAEAFSRALRVEPDVDKILDRILPPIGDVYVDVIWDQVAGSRTDIALKVWDRMATIHPSLPLRDAYYLIDDLIKRKQFADGRRVWDQAVAYAGLADLQGPPGSVLWDGGFESGMSGINFGWLYPENFRAVQIGIDSHEKHSGNHSLRLTFDGRSNVQFTDICHYVLVQPSTAYHFSAWVRPRALTTDQGIRFQLRPIGAQDSSVVVTADVHGSEPWTQVEIPWISGNDVHEMQVCLLRYPSDQEGHRIQGTVWIDDVALVPVSTERAKP